MANPDVRQENNVNIWSIPVKKSRSSHKRSSSKTKWLLMPTDIYSGSRRVKTDFFLKRCFGDGSLLSSVLIKSAEPFQHRCAVSFSLCCPRKPPSLSAPQHGSPRLIANMLNWSPEEPNWWMTCSSKKKKKKITKNEDALTKTGAVEGHIADNEIFVISYEGSVAHHPGWTTCQVKIHKYEVQLKAHHSLMEINFHSGEMSFARATANVSL